jgi:hypothetical protein
LSKINDYLTHFVLKISRPKINGGFFCLPGSNLPFSLRAKPPCTSHTSIEL